MMIAVVSQKGGVGKSTLAVHLALWLHEQDRSVAFIDADGQRTSTRWLTVAAPEIAVVRIRTRITCSFGTAVILSAAKNLAVIAGEILRCAQDDDKENGQVISARILRQIHPDDILETGRKLEAEHDLVIADGPANLAESTRALLLIADLALVPCGPTVPELESTAETLRILSNAQAVRADGKPIARVVLSRFRGSRSVLSRESREAVSALGLPVCKTIIGLREAVADAAGQRTAVWHMGRRAQKAAREMLDLMEEVMTYAQHATEHRGGSHPRTAALPA